MSCGRNLQRNEKAYCSSECRFTFENVGLDCRFTLYLQGLWDRLIAEELGMRDESIRLWRNQWGLPSHSDMFYILEKDDELDLDLLILTLWQPPTTTRVKLTDHWREVIGTPRRVLSSTSKKTEPRTS